MSPIQAPQHRPVSPAMTRPTSVPPLGAPAQPARVGRAWYAEPAVIATIVVLVMVAIAFLVLITAASGGS